MRQEDEIESDDEVAEAAGEGEAAAGAAPAAKTVTCQELWDMQASFFDFQAG